MQQTVTVRLRRVLSISLVLGALLAVHVAAGLTLTAQDKSVAPNGSVVVPIVITDAQDLGGIDLVLVFDPAVLRFESAAPGSLTGRARIQVSETGPGRLAIAVASPGSLTGAGPILALTFSAVGPAGARSAVTLEAVRPVTIDGEPVPAQATNGTVSVGGGPRTPLSPFAVVGALAVVIVASRKMGRSGRSRR